VEDFARSAVEFREPRRSHDSRRANPPARTDCKGNANRALLAASASRVGSAERRSISPFLRPTARVPMAPTPICCQSCFAAGARMLRPFKFPEIGYLAFISTRRTRRKMGWGRPNPLAAPNITSSRRLSRRLATRSFST
jgi:hypothetical protein